MPTSGEILAGLTTIANDALALAVIWHVFTAAAILALLGGWRPGRRLAASLLTLLPASVSALAFLYGNPFNGTVFGVLVALLVGIGARLDPGPVSRGATWVTWLGVLMLGFGWLYPHFLEGRPIVLYAIAAPTGLVPCPSLALLIGFTLLADDQFSRAWALTLATFGLFYALFGIFRLGMFLDAGLFLGVVSLLVTPTISRSGAPLTS